jgi:hypothetical protein
MVSPYSHGQVSFIGPSGDVRVAALIAFSKWLQGTIAWK